ncbi:MAG: hypothetical protein NVS9B9_23590 [Ktedonobacteraceae bacterium]
METTQSLITNLKFCFDMANKDLSMWDPRTRPGMETQKQLAGIRLPDLQKDWAKHVKSNSTAFLLSGSTEEISLFRELLGEEGDAVFLNAEACYEHLAADAIPAVGGDRLFTGHQVSLVMYRLKDLIRDLAWGDHVPGLDLKHPMMVPDAKSVIRVVRGLVVQAVGFGLNQALMEKVMAGYAFDKLVASDSTARFEKGTFLATVAGIMDPSEASFLEKNLFKGKNHLVELSGKKITKELVNKEFNKLKAKQ